MATDASSQIVTLRRLGIGLSMLAASGPAQARCEQAADVQRTLKQLHALTSDYAMTDEQHLLRMRDIERQIDAAFAGIQTWESTICYEKAIGYISVELGDAPGVFSQTVEVKIVGSHGHWYFTFGEGKTIEAAVQEINSMISWTYASASISAINPYRIEVRSSHYYMEQNYLEIKQVSGAAPMVFASAIGGIATFQWIDYGCSIGVPRCAEPAALYLSSVSEGGFGSTVVLVQGYRGMKLFTFASGTTLNNIAAAIETMSPWTGVTAAPLNTYPYRAKLESTFLGSAGFVSVMQVGGTPPIIYATPQGGMPTYNLLTNGLDRLAGDVNCDRIVTVADLILVVQNWGECPLPPFVCEADLTNDGHVNVQDLWSVLNNWGAVD